MSKNLTRKGLAFGALVALGASVVAGAPAQATSWNPANAITTAYAGTGTTVIEGTDFVLDPTVDSQFNYYNPQTGEFSPTDLDQTAYDDEYDIACNGYEDDYVMTFNNWIPTGSVQWSRSNTAISNNGNTFSADSITADQTGTATPYLDLDTYWDTMGNCSWNSDTDQYGNTTNIEGVSYDGSNGSKDSSEPTGPATSLTFLNNTGGILSVATAGTYVTSTTKNIKTTVSGPTGVNLTQMEDELSVYLYKTGYQTATQYMGNGSVDNGEASDSGLNDFGTKTTGYYTAQVRNNANDVAYSSVSAETIVGQVSPDSAVTSIGYVTKASANETTSRLVRAGTTSFDVLTQLYTADGADDGTAVDAYAKAGVEVKFTVRKSSTSSVIKANGVALTTTDAVITTTTDSNGIAKLAITSDTGLATDQVIVSHAETIKDNGTYDASAATWTWTAVNAAGIYGSHQEGTSPVVGTYQNTSVTLNYEVSDNFGQPLAKNGVEYQIRVTGSGINATSPLSGGKATVTFNNQAAAGTSYSLTTTLEQRANGVTGWTAAVLTAPSTTVVVNRTGSAAASLSANVLFAGQDRQISLDGFVSRNTALVAAINTTEVLPSIASTTARLNAISGTVVDANKVPLAGVPVVISAPGVQFYSASGAVYGVGSATVYADANGLYTVQFLTHKAGVNNFTISSGAGSTTATATYKNPTVLHATDVLTVTAPVAVQSGTVTTVSVQLVDKFGNGINGATVNLGLVGEGYLSANSVVTDNGSASVALINSANDTSKATITASTTHATVAATSRGAGFEENQITGVSQHLLNKTFSQEVSTGSVATVKASSVKGRLNVVVDNSRNETVRVFVDGKLVKKVVASAGHYTIKVNGLKKGKHKVTVTSDYQNLVTKKSVTIK